MSPAPLALASTHTHTHTLSLSLSLARTRRPLMRCGGRCGGRPARRRGAWQVLFVAASQAEWVHWLAALRPHLEPLGAPAVEWERHWAIGGERLLHSGQLYAHAGPHWLALPATTPDHTRCRAGSFSAFTQDVSGPSAQQQLGPRARGLAKERHAQLQRLSLEVAALHPALLRVAIGDSEREVRLCPGDADAWCVRLPPVPPLGSRGPPPRALSLSLSLSLSLCVCVCVCACQQRWPRRWHGLTQPDDRPTFMHGNCAGVRWRRLAQRWGPARSR
jgi:hypothetical protein